jgi:hypothetical protein
MEIHVWCCHPCFMLLICFSVCLLLIKARQFISTYWIACTSQLNQKIMCCSVCCWSILPC